MKSSFNIPKDWTFHDKHVASKFDKHVREQLPWYDLATNAVAQFARHFIPNDGLVYDIGASTGNIGIAIKETLFHRRAKFCAIEQSAEMAEYYKGPNALMIANAVTYDFAQFDFGVCFLVLMFLPVTIRASFLRRLCGLIKPGGALVIVDKIQAPAGYLGTAFSRLTLQQKLIAGTSSDDIIRKELSLAGYQRPLDPAIIPKQADKFFQMGEFSGYIIAQPEI